MRSPFVFEHCCLCNVGLIWWENSVSSFKAKPKVPIPTGKSLEETLNLNKSFWLGYVLHTLTECLPLCVLFSEAGSGWKMSQSGHLTT